MNRYLVILLVFLGAFLTARIDTSDGRCQDAYWKYGLDLRACPSGSLRQVARLELHGARRGAKAQVQLGAEARYTVADADAVQSEEIARLDDVALALVDAKGTATPLPILERHAAGRMTVAIPEVADGDYKLRATFRTQIAPGQLEADVPLYTPARIHVITDRPLYEPGNVVRFRAVALRARDLAPLDGRPGRWTVKDPSGEVLLEEKAPATDWGVVAGTFPLDRLASTGRWTVAWSSGDATDEVGFTVEPFKLPRFRVEATPDRAYYGAGDTPSVRGAVMYSSGAPVANARLDIAWELSGDWPPPLEWEERLLPKQATAGANGRFELALPRIPADLQGRVTMTARIGAVDPAGDRVEGRATLLLSQDGIGVASVTELGDGLVAGFNNRMYVRVTTPDGQVVRNTKIHVTRAWQANDPGVDAALDEDGVASLQLDPGPPVNVVIPAAPYRPAKKPALVTRGDVSELIGDEGASLADQLAMDRWLPALGACAKWVGADDEGDDAATIGMRVDRGGGIVTVGAAATPLGQCVANVVRGKRLAAGGERMYTVTFAFEDPELPALSAEVVSALGEPEGLEAAVDRLAASTRDCLPNVEGALPRALTWRVRANSKVVELGPWVDDPGGGEAGAAIPCVQQRFGTRITLEAEAPADGLGLIKLESSLPEEVAQARPQPTTMLGYELRVTADLPGKPSTTLRVQPGQVPDLRLRVSPILAKVGDAITAELIRGPDYAGTLPDKLSLRHLKGSQKADVKERKATFTVEPGTQGWVEVFGPGVRALVYVASETELAVSVEPEQPRYKPGDQAKLRVQTRIAGQGAQAAVGLFGVDESLAQLVPLAGADSMSRLRPKVETDAPAFGVLDGQALAAGRIRGANAAAATVLRVSRIPTPPELDAVVHASARTTFDPVEELTDHFYTVLAELHVQARRWEATAPPKEQMQPRTMAGLWAKALAACEQRGEKVVDAYGRRLRLSRLPADLLALTDPRVVIVQGTRLPEDTENWARWVQREKP